jgi:hypothetical protein
MVLLASVPAAADHADDLVAEGQALAKQGQLDAAVARFRQADRARPRALHDCLIGLAYLRSEKISEAEIEISSCRRRASSVDPLPDWLPPIEKQVRDGADKLVLVELPALEGRDVIVRELFDGASFTVPGRVHLTPGEYHIKDQAQEYVLVVATGEPPSLRTVQAEPSIAPAPSPAPPPPPAPTSHARAGTYVLAGGATLFVAAAAVHLGVMRPRRNDVLEAQNPAEYSDRVSSFHSARAVTIGLYSAAAVALVAGALLYRHDHGAPAIGVAVDHQSAMLTIEVRR